VLPFCRRFAPVLFFPLLISHALSHFWSPLFLAQLTKPWLVTYQTLRRRIFFFHAVPVWACPAILLCLPNVPSAVLRSRRAPARVTLFRLPLSHVPHPLLFCFSPFCVSPCWLRFSLRRDCRGRQSVPCCIPSPMFFWSPCLGGQHRIPLIPPPGVHCCRRCPFVFLCGFSPSQSSLLA